MKTEQRESVACKAAEAERAPEKASATSSDVWSSFVADIKTQCLNRNFGTLSKSEFDLLVFHYYLLNKQANADGKYVSDYDIGRDLGLTIQRVRSLRERDALKQEPNDGWKDAFEKCLPNAHCDANGDVKIPVPDVNVMKEVRNYFEAHGLYDEYHQNPKLFQCKLDVLIAVCINLKNEGEGNLCKDILAILRESKDGKVSRAVEEQEYPVLSKLKKKAVESVITIVTDIHDIAKAGLGTVCGGWFSLLLKGAI